MPVSRAIRGVGQSVSAILRDVASSRRERASERLDIANLGFRERKEESESSLRRVSAERESYLDTPSTLGEILRRSKIPDKAKSGFEKMLERKNPLTGNLFADEITTPRQAVGMVQAFQLEALKQKGRLDIAEVQAGGRAASALSRKQESNRKEISRIKAKVFERRQDLQKAESQEDENRILKEIIRLNNEIQGLEGTQPTAQPTQPALPAPEVVSPELQAFPDAQLQPDGTYTVVRDGQTFRVDPDTVPDTGTFQKPGVNELTPSQALIPEVLDPVNPFIRQRTGVGKAISGAFGTAFGVLQRHNKTLNERQMEREKGKTFTRQAIGRNF